MKKIELEIIALLAILICQLAFCIASDSNDKTPQKTEKVTVQLAE